MKPLDVFKADDMKLNLTQEKLEVKLDDKVYEISFDDMTVAEAMLIRLQYAREVVIPGQNTAALFKEPEEIKSENL